MAARLRSVASKKVQVRSSADGSSCWQSHNRVPGCATGRRKLAPLLILGGAMRFLANVVVAQAEQMRDHDPLRLRRLATRRSRHNIGMCGVRRNHGAARGRRGRAHIHVSNKMSRAIVQLSNVIPSQHWSESPAMSGESPGKLPQLTTTTDPPRLLRSYHSATGTRNLEAHAPRAFTRG